MRQMIAVARKRKQNSAYTTKGEARPVFRRGPRTFVLSQLSVAVATAHKGFVVIPAC